MTRRIRTIAVVSLIAGAASILPFAAEWFDLSTRVTNLLLFSAIVATFGFSLAIGQSTTLQRAIVRLAGPADRPAHALALVAVVAAVGVTTMLAAAALVEAL